MKLIFNNSGKKLTDKELSEVEKKLGFFFPKSYRNFLLEYNGGKPYPNTLKTDFGLMSISLFYKINSNNNINIEQKELLKEISEFKGVYAPKEFIPIGDDGSGHSLICICINGENIGKIYHWDMDIYMEFDEQPAYESLTLIANSFTDLLNKIAYDENDSFFERLLKSKNFDKAIEFIENVSDINIFYKDNKSYLDLAILDGSKEVIKKILEKGAKKNFFGINRLCIRDELDKVEILVEYGFDINYKAGVEEASPLIISSINCSLNCIKYLLIKKADVNLRDINGKTALTYALEGQKKEKIGTDIYNRYEEIIVLLKEYGATE